MSDEDEYKRWAENNGIDPNESDPLNDSFYGGALADLSDAPN
jgi:hypothetical protein